MAIVLQIRRQEVLPGRARAVPPRPEPGEVGRASAARRFAGYSQHSVSRGLACTVQSWFFCFLLALPSPFPSCADVKGCEVTARGRYWVGVGGRGGPGRAWPSRLFAEFVTSVLLDTRQGFIGDNP